MPQPHNVSGTDWDRDTVVAALPPFDFEATPAPDPQVRTYLRFYDLEPGDDLAGVTHHVGWVRAAGYRVATHYYQCEGAHGTVFLFHGYFDHAGLYTRMIRYCLGMGLNILIYDLPGHGLSSGRPTAIGSFREYQRVLLTMLGIARERVPEPWIAIGQSTGGAVLVDYLLSCREAPDAIAFSGVVLLAPLVRPMGFRSGKFLHALVQPFRETWRRVFTANSNDGEFVRFLKEHDPLQARFMAMNWVTALKRWIPRIEAALPVDYDLAVIQGEEDTTVDWRHNLRVLRRKFRRLRLYQIPTGRHHLVNEADPILAQVQDAVGAEIERVLAEVTVPGTHRKESGE